MWMFPAVQTELWRDFHFVDNSVGALYLMSSIAPSAALALIRVQRDPMDTSRVSTSKGSSPERSSKGGNSLPYLQKGVKDECHNIFLYLLLLLLFFFFRGAWLVCLFNGILVPLRTRIYLRRWILSAVGFLAVHRSTYLPTYLPTYLSPLPSHSNLL